MRVVVDTNIVVRAVIRPQSSVFPVLERLRRRAYLFLYSRATLDELVKVLYRPRLRVKYGVSERTIQAVVRLIVLRGELVHPVRQIVVCRDPSDNKFLELAVAGNADMIVTGDDDLLTLHPFEGIPCLSPTQFLAQLDTSASDRLDR